LSPIGSDRHLHHAGGDVASRHRARRRHRLLSIGWIVLNVIFLYRLTVEKGVFETLQTTIGGVTSDRRLQTVG